MDNNKSRTKQWSCFNVTFRFEQQKKSPFSERFFFVNRQSNLLLAVSVTKLWKNMTGLFNCLDRISIETKVFFSCIFHFLSIISHGLFEGKGFLNFSQIISIFNDLFQYFSMCFIESVEYFTN